MTSKLISSRPIKIWIHGKCFDVKPFNKNRASKKKKLDEKITEASDSDSSIHTEVTKVDCHPVLVENGKFLTKFRLPEMYYRKVLEIPEFQLEALSARTQSNISMPKNNDEDHIVVQSESRENLLEAVNELHSAVAHIRQRNMALQFLCIPCLSEGIKDKFLNLKKEILMLENVNGLHESIFIAPEKLHLTICVFVLLDEYEKTEAIAALHEFKEKSLSNILQKTGPISIEVFGLDCMNKNVKKVDVIYANAKMSNDHEEHNLQSIVNELSNHFYHKGLLKEYQDNVKLHMTVINTKYRKMANVSRRNHNKRISIDATHIMEKFKDYYFGTFELDSIHLSYISSKGEDGFYKPLTIVKLNS